MTATEQRNYAVELMTSRKGKNSYTQGAKRTYFFGYPDNKVGNTTQPGYSDCSAAVRAAIKAATGIDIGGNTSAQINNRNSKGVIIHETDGYYPDESKLLPGDCLYFKGNTSHPLDVGHVEMYIGNGKCCGHGSGTGPKIRDMREYCKSRASASRRYFMTIRWINGSDETDLIIPARRTLKRGMEGTDVKEMQQMLLQIGYDLGSYGPDGDFGPATEAAVKAFQINLGIADTGIVDEALWQRLDAIIDNKGDSDDPQPEPVQVGNLTVKDGTWNIRTGPGKEYAIRRTAKGGEKLREVIPHGWKPVQMEDGSIGWISLSGLK